MVGLLQGRAWDNKLSVCASKSPGLWSSKAAEVEKAGERKLVATSIKAPHAHFQTKALNQTGTFSL